MKKTKKEGLLKSIYFDDISLEQAMDGQIEIEYLLKNLEPYKAQRPEKTKSKEETLKNASKFLKRRSTITFGFENIFPLPKQQLYQHEEWTDEEKGEEFIPQEERLKNIVEKEKSINNELFREYFKYQNLCNMLQNLNCSKNTDRNKIQVNLIKSTLSDLKNKIKNMSENEERIENQMLKRFLILMKHIIKDKD